jgi:hypothetical protein
MPVKAFSVSYNFFSEHRCRKAPSKLDKSSLLSNSNNSPFQVKIALPKHNAAHLNEIISNIEMNNASLEHLI